MASIPASIPYSTPSSIPASIPYSIPASTEITKIHFQNVFHYVLFSEDFQLSDAITKIYYIINEPNNSEKKHKIFFACNESKLSNIETYNIKQYSIYSVTLEQFKGYVGDIEGNHIINIYAHGGYLFNYIENSAIPAELINSATIDSIGNDNKTKFLIFVFCSCYAAKIFASIKSDNVVVIVPDECKTVDLSTCFPRSIGLLTGKSRSNVSDIHGIIDHQFIFIHNNNSIKRKLLILCTYIVNNVTYIMDKKSASIAEASAKKSVDILNKMEAINEAYKNDPTQVLKDIDWDEYDGEDGEDDEEYEYPDEDEDEDKQAEDKQAEDKQAEDKQAKKGEDVFRKYIKYKQKYINLQKKFIFI